MKQKILIPTDFSDNSWTSVVYVLKLFADVECIIYFLHTTLLKVSTISSLSNVLFEDIQESSMKDLITLKSQANITNANPNHEFEVILGAKELTTEVNSAVKSHHIDLVVMGTKGLTSGIDYFIGNHTLKVIKKIEQSPLLIVPDNYEYKEPIQIAFPTNFNRFYEHKELRPLKNIADLYNSKIRIVHINTEQKLNETQEYNMTTLGYYLEDYDHSFHWLSDETNIVKAINLFVKKSKIDLLALVNYKHSFIHNLVNEPVIKKLSVHPNIPLLIIPGY